VGLQIAMIILAATAALMFLISRAWRSYGVSEILERRASERRANEPTQGFL